jgi:calcineurin-like phosphoesterase family protein
MSVWFTSDLHLGHQHCSDTRGFPSVEEHDSHLIENINDSVNKRDKLFILGDLAFSDAGLKRVNDIQCRNIELVLGNHDKYPIWKYLNVVNKIHGFRGYKNYWLTHCPIHPHEIRKKCGNIHGHVHIFGDTKSIDDPRYLCVNVEFHNFKPVSFEAIEKMMSLRREHDSLVDDPWEGILKEE